MQNNDPTTMNTSGVFTLPDQTTVGNTSTVTTMHPIHITDTVPTPLSHASLLDTIRGVVHEEIQAMMKALRLQGSVRTHDAEERTS